MELINIIGKMLRKTVVSVDSTSTQLHGGTVGNVVLYEGTAKTSDSECLPFKIVCKVSGKWERYGDPDSWRREYDLYTLGLETLFTDELRWPECYHAELNDDKIQLWMEYIDGKTGNDLTVDMLEQASVELGRFQGRLHKSKPEVLEKIKNLSIVDAMKNFYHHYRSYDLVYNYIRSDICELPKHLCQMIIDSDNTSNEVHVEIEKLPVVFCHRDFWITNIFHTDNGIRLIDWDTTGWGYLGEDIISLIADEADVEHMIEIFQKCVSAYLKGFSEYAPIPHIPNPYIAERLILHFGYRLVEWFLDAGTPEEKEYHIKTLQKIYEIQSDA